MYYPSDGAAKLTVESYDGYEGLDETTASGSLVKGGYIEASKENVKVNITVFSSYSFYNFPHISRLNALLTS